MPSGSPSASWSNLPAYRWNGNMSFHVNQGSSLTGAVKVAMDAIGSFLWAVAGFIWSALLDVVRWASTTNLLSGEESTVNHVAATVGSAVLANGIIPSVILLAAVIAAVMAFARRGIKGLSHVLISCIFIGGAFATSVAAADNSAGSPAWLMHLVSQDTGYIAGAIGQITPPPAIAGQQASAPNCTSYEDTLTTAFEKANPTAAGGIGSAISSLWLQSYGIPWATAQFGSTPATGRVYCHWLEWTSSIKASTQAQIASTAKYPVPTGNNVFAKHANSRYGGIYGPFYWQSTSTQAMFAWAMCDDPSGANWGSPQEFAGTDPSGVGTWGNVANKYCREWYNHGDGIYGQGINGQNNPFALTTGSKIADAVGSGSSQAAAANNAAASSFFTTWNGSDPVGIILGGFVTLLVAIFFGIVVGALALGTLIAQLIIVLVIGLLPLLFLILAIPSARHHGVEMAKAGIGLFLAKAVFAIVIALFILLTVTLDSLLLHVLPGAANNALSATLLMVLAPLVAFFVLHKLAKMVGFGHIFSVRGALATTGAFAIGDMMGRHRQTRENRYSSAYASEKTFHQRALTGPAKRGLRKAPSGALAGGKALYSGGKKGGTALGKGAKAAALAASGGASATASAAKSLATNMRDRINERRNRGNTAPAPMGGGGGPGGSGPIPTGAGGRGPRGGGPGGSGPIPTGAGGRGPRGGGPGGGVAGGPSRPIRAPFTAPVVGTTQSEHRQAYRKLRDTPNAQLALRREPTNPKDPNAIAVMHGEDRVGYIGAGLAARMAPQMDAGESFGISHDLVTHPDHPDNPGLRLHVTPQPQSSEAEEAEDTASRIPTPSIPIRNEPSAPPRRREPQPPAENGVVSHLPLTERQKARAHRRIAAEKKRLQVGNGPNRRVVGDIGRSGQHSPGSAGVRARTRSS